jgi:hypothetical protein
VFGDWNDNHSPTDAQNSTRRPVHHNPAWIAGPVPAHLQILASSLDCDADFHVRADLCGRQNGAPNLTPTVAGAYFDGCEGRGDVRSHGHGQGERVLVMALSRPEAVNATSKRTVPSAVMQRRPRRNFGLCYDRPTILSIDGALPLPCAAKEPTTKDGTATQVP